jgi:hypothetical protein
VFHFHSSLTPRWIKENKNLTIPPDGTREEEEEKKPSAHIYTRRKGRRERETAKGFY